MGYSFQRHGVHVLSQHAGTVLKRLHMQPMLGQETLSLPPSSMLNQETLPKLRLQATPRTAYFFFITWLSFESHTSEVKPLLGCRARNRIMGRQSGAEGSMSTNYGDVLPPVGRCISR